MSQGNGFAIQVGPPDARGHRQVTATFGDRSHRDRFDTDSAFSRSKFIDKALGKFELGEDAHEHFDTKLLAAAEADAAPLFKPVVKMLSEFTPKPVRWLWR